MEAEGFHGVEQVAGRLESEFLEAVIDELAHLLLSDGDAETIVFDGIGIAVFIKALFMTLVEETQFSRDRIVEDQAARGGDDKIIIRFIESIRTIFLRDEDLDEIMDLDLMQVISQHDFVIAGVSAKLGGIHLIFGFFPLLHDIEFRLRIFFLFFVGEIDLRIVGSLYDGEVVRAEDHILRRNSDWLAVLCGQDVIDGEHQGACFSLCFDGQRQMAGHLVTVEVSVVAWAYERMQLDRAAFPEDRFKSLDTESVQCRCAVQKDRVFFDDIAKDFPDFRSELIDLLACRFEVACDASLDKFMHDERLEEFDRHFLRQAALIHFELRSDDDNGTAGVVDTFTEEVLTETSLLALQHVGEGFQRTVARAGDGASTTTVIDQGIDSFLKHTLFVSDDDFRSTEFQKSLQTVISIDDAAIEVIQVGGGETAAIELNHRAQIRRDDRQDREDHPFRLVAGVQEGFDFFETTDASDLALTAALFDLFLQCFFQLRQIELFQQVLDRFCAHLCFECFLAIGSYGILIFLFIQDLALGQVRIARIEDDISSEVEDSFELARRDLKDEADTGRCALEVPDMGNWAGQRNMAHAFTADFRGGDFDAALVADGASVTHLLVLAAFAFPVFGRSENLFTEEAVGFCLQGSVIDGFRLCHFPVRPFKDLFRRSDTDFHGIKFIYI